MKNPLLTLFDGIYLACIWVAGLSIFIMSLIIPIGVFARYVLGFGAAWPEPIAILLMVIFTFVGAAAAYRAGAHIAVAMITDRMPVGMQGLCRIAVNLLMLVVSLFMMFYGGKLSMEMMGQTITALPWLPVGVTYLPVPIGGFLTLLFVFETLMFGPQHERAIIRFDHQVEEAGA